MQSEGLVTICIPTYNSERWIEETISSALRQEYEPLEVLAIDDASTDGTLERLRAVTDPRLRIQVNERNVGLVRNFNRCVHHARGEYVKFLLADDLLYPGCVSEMVRLFAGHPRMGLVFTTREVLLEDPSDVNALRWKAAYGKLHTQFERISEVNDGQDLFRQYLTSGFRMNWVGEPSCVMVRRECFERLGMFNSRMHQGLDFEMWLRIMYFYDVGFIDRDLSAFRVHTQSATSSHHRSNKPWLDMFWLIEGLLRHPEIARSYPQIQRLRFLEAARLVRSEYRRLRAGMPPPLGEHARSLYGYLAYRVQRLLHAEPDLHGDLG